MKFDAIAFPVPWEPKTITPSPVFPWITLR